MTKKHFIALADCIKRFNAETTIPISLTVFTDTHIRVLADFCATQNPRFNRERWLNYIAGQCGPNGGKY